MDDIEQQRGIGLILAKESPEDLDIQQQLRGLMMWEYVFSNVLCRRDTIERTHGIRFEIRTKENGHNAPHCHAEYQGQNISISLVDCSVLAGNIPKEKQRIAVEWVRRNLPVLQKHWNRIHTLEV